MENFIDQRLPSQISFGIEFGSEFQTEITTTSSGKEYRSLIQPYHKKKYYLAAILYNQEEVSILNNFFYLVKGRLNGFRFNDLLDNKIENQQIAIADGKTRKFQIVKNYYYGQQLLYSKNILYPLTATLKVYFNRRKISNFKLLKNGIVEFTAPPLNKTIIKISCKYDNIVRFDNDYLPLILEQGGVFKIEGLKLIELIR